MNNTVNESAIKKLKLLFTVVDRPKGEFYLDVISEFSGNSSDADKKAITFQRGFRSGMDILKLNPGEFLLVKQGCYDTVPTEFHISGIPERSLVNLFRAEGILPVDKNHL